MNFLLNRKKGFTLIELMIVMAIIAILAVLGIAAISTARKTSHNTQRQDIAKTIQIGLEGWYAAYKSYPKIQTVVNDLGQGWADAEIGWSYSVNPCSGVPAYLLFNVDDVRPANWNNGDGIGHGNLSQFVTGPLMDPRGYDMRIITRSDCTNYPGEATVRGSYGYKWVSPSSYGLRVRNELVRPDCNTSSGARFGNGTLNSSLASCDINKNPFDSIDPLANSFLFKIE